MNKPIATVFVALFAITSRHAAQEPTAPAELQRARAAYQQQIKALTEPVKLRYAQTLEALKKSLGARGDLQGALAVQHEMDSLGMPQLPPLGSREDAQLVIWNQNNGGKGDRGTRKINVILRAGTKEVWRKNGIRMSWDQAKQGKEVLSVPSFGVDTIRIEVTESINHRGGLAEVEFLKDGKNIAAGCSVMASGFWETNPKHAPAKLTDGEPGTFWLLPDNNDGWAEIRLKDHR